MIRPYRSYWTKKDLNKQPWRAQYQHLDKIIIEIGAGQGLHAIQFAAQHPDTLYIAIERTQEKFARMLHRKQHHPHIQNLLCINEDAVKWISENIGENEVNTYFILYPNPYPKAKQANKRWHYMPFMSYLIKTLQGSLTLATNIESYYQDAQEQLSQYSSLKLIQNGPVDLEIGRTHFERKYLQRGEECYQLSFKKIEQLSSA